MSAYGLRISDWSSDVCAFRSPDPLDLVDQHARMLVLLPEYAAGCGRRPVFAQPFAEGIAPACPTRSSSMRTFPRSKVTLSRVLSNRTSKMVPSAEIGRESGRERVGQEGWMTGVAVTFKQ